MNQCNRWGKKHLEHLALARALRKQTKHLQQTKDDRRRNLGYWHQESTPELEPPIPLPKAPDKPLEAIQIPEPDCIAHAELLNKLKDHPEHNQFALLLHSLTKSKPKPLPPIHSRQRIGYTITTSINKIEYASGRVRWMQYYQREPLFVIDHTNGDKKDNRINNLRDIPYCLLRMNYSTPYEPFDETLTFLHQTYYNDLPPEKRAMLYGTPNKYVFPR